VFTTGPPAINRKNPQESCSGPSYDGFVRLRFLATLALAVACGGESEKDGTGGTGGSATGGSTSGGTGGTGTGATGGTGTGATGGTGTGATGGTGTGGIPGCAELDAKYAAYLTQDKGCNAMINAIQCTELIDTELSCPCSTYVNPTNTTPLQELKSLKAEWTAKGCDLGVACPEIACPVPQGSGCQVNGAGGDGDGCVDYGPD
jgi:hypothetical protein